METLMVNIQSNETEMIPSYNINNCKDMDKMSMPFVCIPLKLDANR